MAERVKLEMTTKQAILAVLFVMMTLLVIGLAEAGFFANPLTVGLLITLTIGLILVGHVMVRAGVLTSGVLPMWYFLTFGVVLLIYGGISAGYIPVAFTLYGALLWEIAITNAMFYTLVALAVIAAIAVVYASYRYYKRRAIGAV